MNMKINNNFMGQSLLRQYQQQINPYFYSQQYPQFRPIQPVMPIQQYTSPPPQQNFGSLDDIINNEVMTDLFGQDYLKAINSIDLNSFNPFTGSEMPQEFEMPKIPTRNNVQNQNQNQINSFGELYNFVNPRADLKFLVVIDDVLTPEQCKQMMEIGEKHGLEDINRGGMVKYQRSTFKDKRLADSLFFQLRNYIPKMYNGRRIVSMNDHFIFSKYDVGGKFDIHKDEINNDSFGNKSIMTFNIFLNEDFEGGETDFYYEDRKTLRKSVKPKIGKGVLFDSQQYHCGNEVKSGNKFLLRTDVMIGH